MTVTVRIEQPHTDTTPELTNEEGVQYHQVIEDSAVKPEWRTIDGQRRKGWYRWQRYRCNNPDCEFAAWVSMFAVEQAVAVMIDQRLSQTGHPTTEEARHP